MSKELRIMRYIGWAMTGLAFLMLSSCNTSRKVTNRTETMKTSNSLEKTTSSEMKLEDITRKLNEKQQIHIVWYDTEDTSDEPVVKAEAWITSEKDEETTEQLRDTINKTTTTLTETEEDTKEEEKTETKMNGSVWITKLCLLAGLLVVLMGMILILKEKTK